MDRRLQLHSVLTDIMGSSHVYFQPPANIQMQYPCIVYHRDSTMAKFADNSPYRLTKRYQVTVIDTDPDSVIPDKIEQLPLCRFNRFFTSENLNHTIFNLYF